MLTVQQTAERLNVSPQVVYALCSSGKLPSYRIGLGRGAVRVSEDDLAEYLESCRQNAKPRKQSRTLPKLKHLSVS